jgi:signal transduction histidine kinase
MSSLLHDREPVETRRAEPRPDDVADLVQSERLRIARELHDIFSFGFATIAVQAGVAAHVADSRPEQAVEALQAIRAASRDVLDDVRAVLGQLRDDEDAAEPARGIGQLDSLANSAGRAGVQAAVRILGRSRPLPLPVDLCVYRVVQEGLANAARHAPGATVSITLAYERNSLAVTIEDDGRSKSEDFATEGSGYGLIGMRERVRALGGDLDAEALPGRGFQVRATVPYRARS